MRISVAIVLIAMGAIIVATATCLYAGIDRGSDSPPKQAAMPMPAPTATLEPVPTPTGAIATAVPTRTPAAVSGGPVLPQIPFPSPAVQRTPRLGETAAILNPRPFDELPDSSLLRQRSRNVSRHREARVGSGRHLQNGNRSRPGPDIPGSRSPGVSGSAAKDALAVR